MKFDVKLHQAFCNPLQSSPIPFRANEVKVVARLVATMLIWLERDSVSYGLAVVGDFLGSHHAFGSLRHILGWVQASPTRLLCSISQNGSLPCPLKDCLCVISSNVLLDTPPLLEYESQLSH